MSAATITMPGTWEQVTTLWRHLPAKRRRLLVPVVLIVVLSGMAELLSIGAVVPFITLLAGLETGSLPDWLVGLIGRLDASDRQVMIAATCAIAFAAVAAGSLRLLVAWSTQKLVSDAVGDLSIKVYENTLRQPYPVHVNRNSASALADINKTAMISGTLFTPLIQGISALVIALFVIAALLWVNPLVALSAGAGFGLIYWLVMRLTREPLLRHGQVASRAWESRIKIASEGLGGIRDIILDNSFSPFIRRFAQVERRLFGAQHASSFLSAAPRFIVEGLGIILLAVIALWLALRDGGIMQSLPTLAALALGAQRLLPLAQQIFAGWAARASAAEMLRDISAALQPPASIAEAIVSSGPEPELREGLSFEDVSFSYPGTRKPAVAHASFSIEAGERVGIFGPSGSGKSTLMDLILGLQAPTSGRILVDGVELGRAALPTWRRHVAHVPQFIYLADASIAENIAFGLDREQIDRQRVEDAARRAQLADFIATLPDGFETVVGERGTRLSGGQRQRIGIARALYKRARLLVFDEATSALDYQTEADVNAAIKSLDRNLTLVVIAHRRSSLAVCDRWLSVQGGSLRESTLETWAERHG